MKLNELMAYNGKLTIPRLQQAYEEIVKLIRLKPSLFPIKVSRGKVGGFAHPAYLANDSEICFREVRSLHNVTLTHSPSQEDFKSIDVLSLTPENNSPEGFCGAQSEYPEVYFDGQEIAVTNLDEAYLFITAFAFPYFVSNGDPEVNTHVYDIQTMVDTYGADKLTVDPVLLYVVPLKALSIYHSSLGEITSMNGCNSLCNHYMNIYNEASENTISSNFGKAVEITGWI